MSATVAACAASPAAFGGNAFTTACRAQGVQAPQPAPGTKTITTLSSVRCLRLFVADSAHATTDAAWQEMPHALGPCPLPAERAQDTGVGLVCTRCKATVDPLLQNVPEPPVCPAHSSPLLALAACLLPKILSEVPACPGQRAAGRTNFSREQRFTSRGVSSCFFFSRTFLLPRVLRGGGTYGYASRLGPVRRLPASNSPNGTSRSSDGSLGPAMGSSRSEQACARSAANAAWAFQCWFRACRAAAAHHGCVESPRRPLASPCPREQSQERQGAAADPPANFNAENNQAAAPSLPQFRVSSVFAVDCLVEGEARLVVSPWAWLAIPSDWAHDCGIRPAKWGVHCRQPLCGVRRRLVRQG